jgi:hypothetical protein
MAVRPARSCPVDRVPQAGRPAGEPIRCSGRVQAGGRGPRARAAEPMRPHPTHQSHRPHLRGTSGFRGNFGQLGLPGCSATAGCSAVISGSRNRRAICRPGRVAHGVSGAPGTGTQLREPAGHGPAWCAPGPVPPGDTAIRPQINARPPPPHLSGTGPLACPLASMSGVCVMRPRATKHANARPAAVGLTPARRATSRAEETPRGDRDRAASTWASVRDMPGIGGVTPWLPGKLAHLFPRQMEDT